MLVAAGADGSSAAAAVAHAVVVAVRAVDAAAPVAVAGGRRRSPDSHMDNALRAGRARCSAAGNVRAERQAWRSLDDAAAHAAADADAEASTPSLRIVYQSFGDTKRGFMRAARAPSRRGGAQQRARRGLGEFAVMARGPKSVHTSTNEPLRGSWRWRMIRR